jgi:signal peptidase I
MPAADESPPLTEGGDGSSGHDPEVILLDCLVDDEDLAADRSRDRARPVRARRRKSLARQWLESVAIALIVAFLLRGFAVQAFKIPSSSMMPTLQVGDHVLVDKLRYGIRNPLWNGWLLRFATPAPGDVIVFAFPVDPTNDFVKRVIAVEGEEVEIRDKQVLVDGQPRDIGRPYFVEGRQGTAAEGPRDNFGPAKVPKANVFVLGDNRDRSFDSRFWGFVDLDEVKGKAMIVYWSWDGRDGWVRWERLGEVIR